jgi:putative transposase
MPQYGMSDVTFYNWKAKYGGVSVSELKRLKDLEAENAKLKRMYADLALENTAIKDVLNRNVWSASLLQGQKTSDGDSSH